MRIWKKYGVYVTMVVFTVIFVLGLIVKPKPESPIIFSDNEINEPIEDITFIYVDIKGAVAVPGVYKVQKSTRLFQVVNLAGGLTSDADENAINLSMILGDQDVVYIPTIGEEYPNITVQDPDEIGGIININTADISDLETLSGIGPATAQNIIDYRTENGPFESIEDIMNVSGIGESTFETIKDSITT